MENLESNPFFDKYAERIRVLQKTKPEEFNARVEQLKESERRKGNDESKFKSQEKGGNFSNVTSPKQVTRQDPSYNKEQKLKDVMKMDLITDKTLIEISEIWKDYHRTKDKMIAAVIPAYKENAPECLNVIHYTELQEEKGIVLMRGEYDDQILNGIEAQCLANQVQLYYTCPSGSRKFKLLETFNTDPNEFKHSDLIDELQNVELVEKSQQ